MPGKSGQEPTKKKEESSEESSEEEEETPLEFVAGLPDGSRQNVLALQGLQEEYQKLFLQYVAERTSLGTKYQKLHEPLYARRSQIVKGESEATAEEVQEGEEGVEAPSKVEEEGEAAASAAAAPAGIPNFWRTAILNQETLQDAVCEWDKEALGHLIDVRAKMEDDPHAGFELEFEFSENPYFSNKVLTKKIVTKLDEDDGEDMLVKFVGAKIDWKDGKDLTVELKKKKQKSKKGQGTRVVTKPEPRDSFFNFFSPPDLPEDTDDMEEEVAERAEEDYERCRAFTFTLIPRAIDYFTGDALPMFDLGDGLFGGEDDDDEDEDDEESPKKRKGKKALGGAPEGDKPECKQQ